MHHGYGRTLEVSCRNCGAFRNQLCRRRGLATVNLELRYPHPERREDEKATRAERDTKKNEEGN
jgi:hypothetical protein